MVAVTGPAPGQERIMWLKSSTISPAELVNAPNVRAFILNDDGLIPNNSALPLLIYRGGLKLPRRDRAGKIERLLELNHWSGCWRNGIYDYHHYHSTAHEVLVVYGGSATVLLGGELGLQIDILPGDVLVLPAGTGHKNLRSSEDFAVVGAYPEGQSWDMCYGKPEERPGAEQNIPRVPLPKSDPIYGDDGPLMQRWRLH